VDSTFEWIHPEAFILILPLCIVWLGLALYARSRRRAAAGAFVAAAMQPRIVPKESAGRFWTKTVLVGAALVFGLIALARPRFGVYYEDVKARGSDIYILIDVSRSMLATDVPPSRLERAKSDVTGLLNKLHGERVGLIAFAGVAVVKCPLTTDYNFFRMALNELSPNSVPKGGTAIGDAIRKALDVMPKLNEREQAMLLITDGDDQDSFPLEAAAAAAEHSVTIFTVGLGDTVQGARVPSESTEFMTYKGEQVWSKMDETLLKDIALKTHGAYVPARTRAYDLGELYADHLAKMRGADGATQKRMRLSEQYQWFLGLAVLCLIADLLLPLYAPRAAFAKAPNPPAPFPAREGGELRRSLRGLAPGKVSDPGVQGHQGTTPPSAPTTAPPPLAEAPMPQKTAERMALLALATMLAFSSARSRAAEEREMVREGLELYQKNDFDGAKDRFEKAIPTDANVKDAAQAADAAVAAFDLACALQRKGDADQARANYLKAAMSPDKAISASSRYNLGCMAADAARVAGGEHPEEAAADKRKEILEKLKEAVASFRMCLEIQPDRADARKNLETIRMWVKLYTDKWRELDKKKQREQANLIQYLESIMETQRVLRESVLALKPDAMLDVFALHKQAQRELLEEIEPLKQKIQTTLKQPLQPQGAPGAGAPPPKLSSEEEKQLDEAIGMLQKWADAAGAKMKSAADYVDGRNTTKSAEEQKDAIGELEKIWDAVVPFNLLLAHDLAAETAIVKVLHPEGEDPEPLGKIFDWFDNLDALKHQSGDPGFAPAPGTGPVAPTPLAPEKPKIELTSKENEMGAELQERTRRRTDLLKAKAEAELQQLEKQPPPPAPPPADPKNPQAQPPGQGPDPEKVKEGLRKAVELAPKASEHMDAAAKSLRKDDGPGALPEAQEAKRILEEILKAQPKPPQQDQKDQDKKDQDKKDQQKKDQQKDQQKKDQQKDKKDQDKKDEKKGDQDKKDQDKKGEQDKDKKDPQQGEPKDKEQMSKEQAEAILRRVREREQQHRKDQEKMARALGGPMPVDKDW